MSKDWIKSAVNPEHAGDFTAWCKRNGFSGVTQAAINKAAKEGGHTAKMAEFAANVSKGRLTYPKHKKGFAEGGPVEMDDDDTDPNEANEDPAEEASEKPDEEAAEEREEQGNESGPTSGKKGEGEMETSFKQYAKIHGIDEDLINEGDDLEKAIATVKNGQQKMQLSDNIKSFIKALGAAEKQSREVMRDPKLAGAYKEMRGDATDLLAALDMSGTAEEDRSVEQNADEEERGYKRGGEVSEYNDHLNLPDKEYDPEDTMEPSKVITKYTGRPAPKESPDRGKYGTGPEYKKGGEVRMTDRADVESPSKVPTKDKQMHEAPRLMPNDRVAPGFKKGGMVKQPGYKEGGSTNLDSLNTNLLNKLESDARSYNQDLKQVASAPSDTSANKKPAQPTGSYRAGGFVQPNHFPKHRGIANRAAMTPASMTSVGPSQQDQML